MKRQTTLLFLAGLAALLVAAFMAGNALAATSCFTDTSGHWAETYICWLKDNKLSSGYPDGTYRPANNITRAEAAVLLKNQADIPPSNGLIYVTLGPSDWYLMSGGNEQVGLFLRSYVYFGRPVLGESEIAATPTLLASYYGRNLKLVRMELCYQVDASRGYLDKVYLTTGDMAEDGAYMYPGIGVLDDTDRSDGACRSYQLPSKVEMTERSRVGIRVIAQNSLVAGPVVAVGRTTLVFEPTTTSNGLTP